MTQPTGILFITNGLWPGGPEEVLLALAGGLSAEGKYRPIIACFQETGSLAERFERIGVPVHPNLLKDRYDARIVPRLMRLVKDYKARVVIPVGSGGDCSFWGTLGGRIAGARVVVWSHGFSQPGHSEFEITNRVIYPLVDKFVALGPRHKLRLVRRDKVPAGRIAVIPNGIEVGPNGNPHWRDRARAILGLADENIVAVGMIARLQPGTRPDVFIHAARRVVNRFRDVHFFIIGDGPDRGIVRLWAEKSELLGKSLSLFGHREDVSNLLPGLDLVCVCREVQEYQSSPALQAMAAGVPVLSNVIDGLDETLADNRTGFFYDPLTPDALAGKILEVISNSALRRTVADASRKLVVQKFTAERLVKNFSHLFDQLLANPYRPTGTLAYLSTTFRK